MKTKAVKNFFDKYSPTCGVTGFLMIIGCLSVIYFTYDKEWDAYAFTVSFGTILTGGKGMKILDKRFGSKK